MIYLVITILIIVLFIYVNSRWNAKQSTQPVLDNKEETVAVASDCCGAHEVCDFDEEDLNEEIIVYFNDEELDVLRYVRESDLTADQIDSLREVLYTLQPREISKWLVSLGRRHIHLPDILKQEARQLVAEA